MPPATLALILEILEEAISITPGLIDNLKALFAKTDATPEDWETLRKSYFSKTYADYVPETDLPIVGDLGTASPPPVPNANSGAAAEVTTSAAPAPAVHTVSGVYGV